MDEQFKNTALHSMKSLIPHKFTRTSCDLLWFISTAQKQIRKHNKLYHQYKISHSLDLRSRFLSLEHEIQWQMRQSHNVRIAKLITTDLEDESSTINSKNSPVILWKKGVNLKLIATQMVSTVSSTKKRAL